ncbi:hypothetical protein SMITH_28 [Smithella sp. ME-1]|uniref:Uncharacterized protein n=1 Tax=hydrocarbon metagenome TaxID=938273 RepID=A0A0W8FM95_9ZZZZ|nr:hypothetical protein SMITH_28 [Smithella sp. ME-1]
MSRGKIDEKHKKKFPDSILYHFAHAFFGGEDKSFPDKIPVRSFRSSSALYFSCRNVVWSDLPSGFNSFSA